MMHDEDSNADLRGDGSVPDIDDLSLASQDGSTATPTAMGTVEQHADHDARGEIMRCDELMHDDGRHGEDYSIDVGSQNGHYSTLDEHEQQLLRPILVGYAFGPKKMSTMGVVMAEASRALSTVTMEATRVAPAFAGSSPTAITSSKKKPQADEEASQSTATTTASSSAAFHSQSASVVPRLTPAALERRNSAVADMIVDSSSATMIPNDMESQPDTSVDNVYSISNANAATSINTPGIRISIGGPGASGTGGIRNIIRFFQSNCSSADTASFADSSITTTTAGGGGTGGGGGLRSGRSASVAGSARSTCTGNYSARTAASANGDGHQQRHADGTQLQAVRVSFVPLDLDSPLEEQHGGKFDAILHKMTEDILYLSKIKETAADNTTNSSGQDGVPMSEQAQRVGRLTAYKSCHPACCLVDHPTHVEALMSRSAISHILSRCLTGVTTRSGIKAGTPRFIVANATCSSIPRVEDLVDQAPFSYPIIVKPLPAAGTKASHHMRVVLNRHGSRRVQFPCLLQEYANHNGTLYKVYVLGDTVRVFPRNSLPNLPRGERLCIEREQQDHPGYVKFDSQRPYPKLSDFGVKDAHPQQKADADSIYSGPRTAEGSCPGGSTVYTCGPGPAKKRRVTMQDTLQQREKEEQCSKKLANAKLVTADEIRPIATALRKAFRLELFGFDILVTQDNDDEERDRRGEGRTMLVVDVNYFPSYKEMSNFPNMLAQYLTQRAVEGRMRSYNSRQKK